MKRKVFTLNHEKKTRNWHNTDFILKIKFQKEYSLAKYSQ